MELILSPVFHLHSVATRKYKNACVAFICGSHYILNWIAFLIHLVQRLVWTIDSFSVKLYNCSHKQKDEYSLSFSLLFWKPSLGPVKNLYQEMLTILMPVMSFGSMEKWVLLPWDFTGLLGQDKKWEQSSKQIKNSEFWHLPQ